MFKRMWVVASLVEDVIETRSKLVDPSNCGYRVMRVPHVANDEGSLGRIPLNFSPLSRRTIRMVGVETELNIEGSGRRGHG